MALEVTTTTRRDFYLESLAMMTVVVGAVTVELNPGYGSQGQQICGGLLYYLVVVSGT